MPLATGSETGAARAALRSAAAAALISLINLLGQTKASAASSPPPLNVLFIAIDDLRPELGCYGSACALTPNLDKLASQGVLFTRHYAAVPTCGSSRYAMLTGRSPARSGAVSGNAAFFRGPTALSQRPLDAAQSLPELFRRSGYRTVLIGKISHTPDGKVFAYSGKGDGREELPGAWDELATPYGPWKRGWGIFFAYSGGRHREDGQGHRDLMEFTAARDEDLPDGMMARRAVEKLRKLKKTGRPWFLGLGFFKPHLPFVAPRQDWEALQKLDAPPPPHPDKPDSAYWHRSGEFYGYNFPFPKTNPLAPADRIRARRAYLACVRYTDRQAGKVLRALDELGLAKSTVVVVWGDHGWHLGDSAIWGKHTPFERALRSALIIRAPGASRPGLRCDALVSSLDLYPTLVDLCRPAFAQTRWPLDGKSLKPLLTGEKSRLHNKILGFWGKAVTVRTDRRRLIARRSGDRWTDIELYDMESGPDPVRNLASEEPQLVAELLRALPAPRSQARKN
ncbi:MAG: sulfatase [Verrucomicrobia bacterium]|nr:sulfatase [Verrucomicrobiota bacterium]